MGGLPKSFREEMRIPPLLTPTVIERSIPRAYREFLKRRAEAGKGPTPWQISDAGAQFLYLQISQSKIGAPVMLWRYKRSKGKKFPRDIERALGAYPLVSLAKAREAANSLTQSLADGIDPREEAIAQKAAAKAEQERQRLESETFADAVALYLQRKAEIDPPRWGARGEAARKAEINLRLHILPVIASVPVALLSWKDVAAVMKHDELLTVSPDVARQCLTVIRNVLDYATNRGVRTISEDPTQMKGPLRIELEPLILRQEKKERHRPMLPVDQVPTFMKELREINTVASRALMFVILTTSREGSIIFNTRNRGRRPYDGISRDDIDLDAGEWTVPAIGMKKGVTPFTYYLSSYARRLVENEPIAQTFTGKPSSILFPSPMDPGRGLSSSALPKVIHEINRIRREAGLTPYIDPMQSKEHGEELEITVHGFRSCFRTWAVTAFSRLPDMSAVMSSYVPEIVLDHKVPAITNGNSYWRPEQNPDLVPSIRRLMEAWGRYCMSGLWPDDPDPVQ